MAKRRRVNVFSRTSGDCIHDDVWVSSGAAGAASSKPALEPIPAATVWSLVQVFVQFARELDGGNVQKLIFRTPQDVVGKSRRFGSGQAHRAATQHPLLIHLAYDALFVVTLSEVDAPRLALRLDGPRAGRRSDPEVPSSSAELSKFCNALLQFVAGEQAKYCEEAGGGAFRNEPVGQNGTWNAVPVAFDRDEQQPGAVEGDDESCSQSSLRTMSGSGSSFRSGSSHDFTDQENSDGGGESAGTGGGSAQVRIVPIESSFLYEKIRYLRGLHKLGG